MSTPPCSNTCTLSRRFDGYMLVKALLHLSLKPSRMVAPGNRLMLLVVAGVMVRDLNLFTTGSLSSLGGALDLESVKGFFPHRLAQFLSVSEMMDFTLNGHPALKFYNPERCRTEESLAELKAFVHANKDQPFRFRREAETYCLADCRLLAQSAFKLDGVLSQQTGGCVSLLRTTAFTISQLTTFIFRRLYYTANSIGLIPTQGMSPVVCTGVGNCVECVAGSLFRSVVYFLFRRLWGGVAGVSVSLRLLCFCEPAASQERSPPPADGQ
jgi:hypothetical protein